MLSTCNFRRLASVANRSCRQFSSESPKITIAKNILLLKEISEATNEEALTKALKSTTATIDPHNLPKELSEFQPYLALSSLSNTDKFVPDATAWQNMSFMDFAQTELKRDETWPFFVGLVAVNLLLGVGLALSLPNEGKKNSKYMQLLQGKKHDDHHADDHHH